MECYLYYIFLIIYSISLSALTRDRTHTPPIYRWTFFAVFKTMLIPYTRKCLNTNIL